MRAQLVLIGFTAAIFSAGCDSHAGVVDGATHLQRVVDSLEKVVKLLESIHDVDSAEKTLPEMKLAWEAYGIEMKRFNRAAELNLPGKADPALGERMQQALLGIVEQHQRLERESPEALERLDAELHGAFDEEDFGAKPRYILD